MAEDEVPEDVLEDLELAKSEVERELEKVRGVGGRGGIPATAT
ncbi:hypothetical protein [Aeropyrum camini]|nr:hypothetical protein [Aeropyrum camini]